MLIAGLIVLTLFNLFFGPISLQADNSQIWWDIFIDLRLPRTVVAILAGAVLALNGLMLQNWLHNPLAAPYVLGIESLSTFGILIWTLASTGVGFTAIPGLAQLSYAAAGFLSCIAGMLLLLTLFRMWGKASFVLIVGLLIGGLISGMTNMISAIVPIEKIRGIYFWGMGSFENIYGYDLIIFISIMIISFFSMYGLRNQLSTFALGEKYVRALGINSKLYLNLMVLLVSLSVGTITAYCGPIAFLSMITPHITRKLFQRGSFKSLFIPTALMGGLIALLAQLFSTSLLNGMPLNAALGLMGFPVLLWMVWANRREILA
jgi:iron complex transport system permease protein